MSSINIPGAGAPSYRYSVSTSTNLPASGNTAGDYIVAQDTGIAYGWNGSAWVASGTGGSGGTVTNVTGTSPITVASGTTTPAISLAAGVWNAGLTAAYNGSPPVTRVLYVDNARTDSFTPTGSFGKPFATIGAAVTQIITNADNSTHQYTIAIAPGTYSETITLNNAALYNLNFVSEQSGVLGSGSVVNVSGLTSTSNNTQLATLIFSGINFNGNVNLTGDTNGTNFASAQVLFANCQFNNSSGTIVLNNINNVNIYGGQIQGSGSVATFTNVAFAYVTLPEGFISGTTLHLVDNPGGNVPSQYSGNYCLLSDTKCYSTVTIDAGSELDSLIGYFGSGSAVTNNGTIHSWQTGWNGTLTCNNGSTTRVQGDVFLAAPTINSGATFTNRGYFNGANATLGASAVAATNAIIVFKDGHLKSTQTTAPTTTINGNAGTGSSSSVSNATDSAGSISLTTGTASWAAGTQTTINFNKAYNVAPIITLTPSNAKAAANIPGFYVTSSTAGFTVSFNAADTAQNTYTYMYHVIETQ